MARLEPLDLTALSPEQKEVADAIMAGPRGGLRGPFEAWLRSPVLADRGQRLGEFCRFHTSLPKHLSEFAIILTGKHWKAQYEFFAHARMALEAGLPRETVEAVRTGGTPAFRDDAERAVYTFVTEYFATNRVSDATYQQALAALGGERGVVDLIGIVGYYGLVSMTLNVFDVGLPPGEPLPLA
ncbi:MAG: carboxymuconolactone decarboxylase family protein [Dehalococcoidia bacterium]|nr:MAG: carboxymuconolactone decarboxylase family protein [Dehalococcoidia bacterium]